MVVFALISFILLAVRNPVVQVELLVWIFAMRVMMVIASGLSYFVNDVIAKARYGNVRKMNFEAPLTMLVWLTSIISVISYLRVDEALHESQYQSQLAIEQKNRAEHH